MSLWWGALHGLLAAAAVLVGVPVPLRLAALVAILCHGLARRPRAVPRAILVGADGTCVVPEWGPSRLELRRGTLLCPHWVRLVLGAGAQRRDIVLIADQIPAEQWAGLCARLCRVRRG
jgi:hypothetical protein